MAEETAFHRRDREWLGAWPPCRNRESAVPARVFHEVAQLWQLFRAPQAEEALRESERRLASPIDLMPDGAFVIDGNGVVVAWNRATEPLRGVKAEEMLGKGTA